MYLFLQYLKDLEAVLTEKFEAAKGSKSPEYVEGLAAALESVKKSRETQEEYNRKFHAAARRMKGDRPHGRPVPRSFVAVKAESEYAVIAADPGDEGAKVFALGIGEDELSAGVQFELQLWQLAYGDRREVTFYGPGDTMLAGATRLELDWLTRDAPLVQRGREALVSQATTREAKQKLPEAEKALFGAASKKSIEMAAAAAKKKKKRRA